MAVPIRFLSSWHGETPSPSYHWVVKASRGDQIENAAYFVKKGYAEELQESDLTLESLEEKLSHLLSHKDQYQASMKASTELKSLADFYDLLRKDLA